MADEAGRLLACRTSFYTENSKNIPAPGFIVFYNGREFRPGKEVLRLSDACFCQEEDPDLELKVTVLNIHEGNNRELLERCRTLREYMQYVAWVRRYREAEAYYRNVPKDGTENTL